MSNTTTRTTPTINQHLHLNHDYRSLASQIRPPEHTTHHEHRNGGHKSTNHDTSAERYGAREGDLDHHSYRDRDRDRFAPYDRSTYRSRPSSSSGYDRTSPHKRRRMEDEGGYWDSPRRMKLRDYDLDRRYYSSRYDKDHDRYRRESFHDWSPVRERDIGSLSRSSFNNPLLDGPFKSWRQFADCLDRSNSEFTLQSDHTKRYEEYKQEYNAKHSQHFFEEHKKQEWFRERYDPLVIERKYQIRIERIKKDAILFCQEFENGELTFSSKADDNVWAVPESVKVKNSNTSNFNLTTNLSIAMTSELNVAEEKVDDTDADNGENESLGTREHDSGVDGPKSPNYPMEDDQLDSHSSQYGVHLSNENMDTEPKENGKSMEIKSNEGGSHGQLSANPMDCVQSSIPPNQSTYQVAHLPQEVAQELNKAEMTHPVVAESTLISDKIGSDPAIDHSTKVGECMHVEQTAIPSDQVESTLSNPDQFNASLHPTNSPATANPAIPLLLGYCFHEGPDAPPETTLFIKQIPPTCSRDDLEDILSQVSSGELKRLLLSDVNIAKNFTRIAWVTYTTSEAAAEAFSKYNGYKLNDYEVQLSEHKPRASDRKTKITPQIASKPERLTHDLAQANKLVAQLDAEKSIERQPVFEDNERFKAMTVEQQLDLLILYLRRIHWFCYYSGEEFFSFDSMIMRAGELYLRGTEKYHARNQSGLQWTATLDARIEERLQQPYQHDVVTGQVALKHWLESFFEQRIVLEAEDRARCDLCKKPFRSAEFVAKHLLAKHDDLIRSGQEEALNHVFFLNYINDARRITPVHLALQPMNTNVGTGRDGRRSLLLDDKRRKRKGKNHVGTNQGSATPSGYVRGQNTGVRMVGVPVAGNTGSQGLGYLRNRQIITYVDLDAPATNKAEEDYSKQLQAFREKMDAQKKALSS